LVQEQLEQEAMVPGQPAMRALSDQVASFLFRHGMGEAPHLPPHIPGLSDGRVEPGHDGRSVGVFEPT
jgi:hypothetical protein